MYGARKHTGTLCYLFNYAMNLVIQVYAPTSNAEETEVEEFYEDLQDLLEPTPKKDVLFIIGNWNAKVGSQEIPGLTGKFGPGKAKANRVLSRERIGHSKYPLPKTQGKTLDSTHEHHHMVNTKIRLIIFPASEYVEALYSQQKQDQELTVAQIVNSYC